MGEHIRYQTAELHLEEEKRMALLQERKRSIIEKLGLPLVSK